jgi:hypothetical protein
MGFTKLYPAKQNALDWVDALLMKEMQKFQTGEKEKVVQQGKSGTEEKGLAFSMDDDF